MMKNPSFVLAKIGIAAIPNKTMESRRDDLHEALRREYPLLGNISVQHQQTINVTPNGTEINTDSVPVLSMSNPGDGWAIRITTSAIFLYTKEYVDHYDFFRRLEKLLSVANQFLEVTHYNFSGIRYLNKYKWDDDAGFKSCIARQEFLQPSISDFSMGGSNLQSLYVQGDDRLILNSGVTINSQQVPPDLMEFAQDLDFDVMPVNGVYAHIDLDANCLLRSMVKFDVEVVIKKFDSLHGIIKKAYSEIII